MGGSIVSLHRYGAEERAKSSTSGSTGSREEETNPTLRDRFAPTRIHFFPTRPHFQNLLTSVILWWPRSHIITSMEAILIQYTTQDVFPFF